MISQTGSYDTKSGTLSLDKTSLALFTLFFLNHVDYVY